LHEPTDAQRARLRASKALLDTIDQGVEVRSVSASLRELREVNHFGDLLEESMRRRDHR
jgi:hypothetical protein